jgi:hypothetical protein
VGNSWLSLKEENSALLFLCDSVQFSAADYRSTFMPERTLKQTTTKRQSQILRELHVISNQLDSQGETKSQGDLLLMREALKRAEQEGMHHREFPVVEELAKKYGYTPHQ